VRVRKAPTLVVAAVGAVSFLSSPAQAVATLQAPGCQTVTIQTGTHHGAGTDNDVFLVERRTANRVKLDLPGNTFENGANEAFENICGLYVANPSAGADYVELTLSSEGFDNWQVAHVSVGSRAFDCENRWVVPGGRLRCIDSGRV
jgi:hypothetical protein